MKYTIVNGVHRIQVNPERDDLSYRPFADCRWHFRLTPIVVDWLREHAPGSFYESHVLGCRIDFQSADQALHFRMRWS